MKRPASVKLLIGAQLLLAFIGIAIATYTAVLTRSPEILKQKDAADVVRGLWIGTATLGVPALAELWLAIYLIRRKRWAWSAGMALNLVLAAVFVYSAFSERSMDSDDIVAAVMPLSMVVLYLLAGVRRWFSAKPPVQSAQAA
jgi:hypothetical protein